MARRLTPAEVKQLCAMKGIESSASAARLMDCSVRTVQIHWQYASLYSLKDRYEKGSKESS
ncbi:hypothetical protein UFOVP991_7 [uncultured Caudovirales phage]|uniref:Uncharacterized protein n=1 Tax=uncultured Caudovirales phage TaxID=2100421 RepID=A0A6J5Q975_9CAUD|nr:hypothetical protein UFOVP991_7 [uncultured Caudovirales phage]CAB4182458.1 hypothetical protein UFOVP1076_7 [uncultured Caudovirales phage]CAB4198176.1 hypothetical protein UFOVP1314_50 [uncultured Caudovirales phage]CAB4211295.1 hypothetical protein UFOVP1427_20 [uncultured Caudovirales phage]CAB5237997.1 hypothetical protein UFOVP1523_24 [uncultured Caudovirales phage]